MSNPTTPFKEDLVVKGTCQAIGRSGGTCDKYGCTCSDRYLSPSEFLLCAAESTCRTHCQVLQNVYNIQIVHVLLKGMKRLNAEGKEVLTKSKIFFFVNIWGKDVDDRVNTVQDLEMVSSHYLILYANVLLLFLSIAHI